LLDSWGVHLSEPGGAVQAAAALKGLTGRGLPSAVEESLMLALYRLAEHQFINGIAIAAYVVSHPELELSELERARKPEWLARNAANPIWASAAANFVPLLESLGDQEAGVAAYSALIEWGLHQRDEVGPLLQRVMNADTPELEFLTFALTAVRK